MQVGLQENNRKDWIFVLFSLGQLTTTSRDSSKRPSGAKSVVWCWIRRCAKRSTTTAYIATDDNADGSCCCSFWCCYGLVERYCGLHSSRQEKGLLTYIVPESWQIKMVMQELSVVTKLVVLLQSYRKMDYLALSWGQAHTLSWWRWLLWLASEELWLVIEGLLNLNKGLCWFPVWITFALDQPASVTTNHFADFCCCCCFQVFIT